MSIESIQPIQQTTFKAKTTNFNHNGEKFFEIFQRCQNNSHHSRSRSPKIEVTGILVPFYRVVDGRTHKFRLDSETKEYTLRLARTLENIAKKIEFEEVTVHGWLDLQTNVIEVEKISVSQSNDPVKTAPPVDDPYFDTEYYQEAIARRGKVETAVDYLAS
jgi:hypothetical protein